MAENNSAVPSLEVSTNFSTAGYFRLSWDTKSLRSEVELQQSNALSFDQPTSIYTGQDTASVLSGLPNGQYFYRLKDASGGYSNIVTVQVAHHSLSKAFSFFGLGAFMFAVLVAILWMASHQKDND